MEAYLPSSTFFFFDWPKKRKKTLKFWNLPNIEVFFVGIQNATSFWHINISQKRITLGKAYGIKVGCYCKHLWEHIENSKKIKIKNKINENSTLFPKEKNQCCACKCTYILNLGSMLPPLHCLSTTSISNF
jgi:hypothetical protein